MSSKEDILASIREHTLEQFAKPDLAPLEAKALTYDDPVAQFVKVLEQGGGRGVVVPAGKTLGEMVGELYPDAQRVALAVDEFSGEEQLPGTVFNPDDVELPAELNGTDVAIVDSPLGVAENACCWVEQRSVRHRAIYFIAEALIIVLSRRDIVNNMHEAYRRLPDRPQAPYACFISGPSKTADIEQALVFGAHGARETVALITE